MERNDFHHLATVRLEEARVLLENGFSSGAYYLAGHTLECVLKACFAKSIRKNEFPDQKRVQRAHNHDLSKLRDLVDLDRQFEEDAKDSPGLDANWAVVANWHPTVRYGEVSVEEAHSLIEAIDDPEDGVFQWLNRHW